MPGTHRPRRSASLGVTLRLLLGLLVAIPAVALLPSAGASAAPNPGSVVVLRTYRLALLNDPTYAAAVAPSATTPAETDQAVLVAKQALVDQLNAIFVPELAIRFELAPGTSSLNLDSAAEATDGNGPCGAQACFSTEQLATTGPGCTDDLLAQNRRVVGQLIGAHSYDIGHLLLGFDAGSTSYAQTAGIEFRAYGCASSPAPTSAAFVVDRLAHELARQLGANPTLDSVATDLCAIERYPDTAVEPGSGSSIMGLPGRCGGDDLQARADPYFSTVSQDQVDAYVTGNGDFVPADATAAEVQSVAFTGFDGSDAFRLDFGGTQTAVITRGVNYTSADIKNAVLEAIPSATISKVRAFWNSGMVIDDRGFEMTFVSFADVVNPTVVPVSGTFTALVNDLDEGGQQRLGGTPVTTANHHPTATAPADRTLPVRTPFELTAQGSDADGGALTYQWQQLDVGTNAHALVDEPKLDGALFRMHAPTASASRSFPVLAQVVADNTNAATGTCPSGPAQAACFAEWLPTAAYVDQMHFSVVVRDGSPLGGGVAYDDLTLSIDKTTGPFRVTSQATTQSATGGGPLEVTWTANTAALADQVRITLSTDGGATFPTVLATATPNDGAHTVTLPAVETTSARIRVEAVDNYFYDVSRADLTIVAPPSGLTVDPVPGDASTDHTDALDLSFAAETGNGESSLLSATVSDGVLPTGLALSKTETSGAGVLPGTATWAVSGTALGVPGDYPVDIDVTDGVVTETFPVTVTVTPESATATYTGPTAADAPSSGPDAVEIDLTATVVEEADTSPGSLSTATLTFRDTVTDEVLCVAAPVTAGEPGEGTASCTMSADLGPDPRTYQVALDLGGAWRGVASAATDLVVSPPPPSLTVTGMPSAVTAQHTDPLALAFEAATTAGDAQVLTAEIAEGVLPAGLTLAQGETSAAGVEPGTAAWSVTGLTQAAPGDYPVTIEVGDGELTRSYAVAITVTAEEASASYDGPTAVAADSGGDDAVMIPLTAEVVQADDGHLGSLSTATATFTDDATGDVLCPSVPVVADGTGPGTASCELSADLPAFGGRTYEVTVALAGSWTGTTTAPTDVVVTSPDPAPAPQTTITSSPREWLLADRTTLRFTATQAGATFACTVDGVSRGCAGGSLTLKGLEPGTHRVQVAAVNSEGTPDPTPAVAEFTVPLDDRALRTRSKGWKRAKAGKAYERTFTRTFKRRATLSYDVVDATALSLVIAKAPSYGTVKVFLGKKRLRTVKLKGKRSWRKVVTLKRFSTPVTGRVRIVTQNRRQVRIDGLGVATR